MPATALLKFAIDSVDGPDGQAAELVFSDLPKDVVVKNSDDTGVGSWQLDLLYSPPGATTPATLELAFADDGSSPLNLTVPINIPGSWRFMLKVWSGANRTGAPTDIDIRNVLAKTAAGFHIPPPQIFPLPLPSLSSGFAGAKPNEVNLGGREDLGWSGNDSDGLLNDFLRHFTPSGGSSVPLTAVFYVDPGRTTSTEDGSSSQPFKTAQAAVDFGITLPIRKFTVICAYGDYTAQNLTITAPELGGPNSCVIIGLGGSRPHNNGDPMVTFNNIVVNNGSESGNFWTEFHNIACADITAAADFYWDNFYAATFSIALCLIYISASDMRDFLANGTGTEPLPGGFVITDGDIVGAGSAVGDNEIVVYDQTSGRFVKSSGTTVSALAAATSTAQSTANAAASAASAAQTSANNAQTSADHNPFMETDLAKGASFTLALTDLYKKIRCTAALTITVPLNATVALPVGIRIPLLADVAGLAQVTVVPFSGAVTVKKATSLALTLREQGSPAELWQQATDVWWLLGDLTVSP